MSSGLLVTVTGDVLNGGLAIVGVCQSSLVTCTVRSFNWLKRHEVTLERTFCQAKNGATEHDITVHLPVHWHPSSHEHGVSQPI